MPRVLLIDDSETALTLLNQVVSQLGFEVFLASDGAEGLEKVALHKPDVVVSDLHMPKLNGIEVVKGIKKNWPFLPVIIFTDYADIPLAVQAMREGAHGYVIKGSPFEILIQEIETALAFRGLQQRNQQLEEDSKRLQAEKLQAERRGVLGRVVAGVSHEVNTPLSVLISNLTWMEKSLGTALTELKAELSQLRHPEKADQAMARLGRLYDQRLLACIDEWPEVVESSHTAGQRINRIISDLRRLDQPERRFGTSNLWGALEQAAASCSGEMDRRIQLRWAKGEALKKVLIAEDDMVLMLSSLLLNAVQAVRPEDGQIDVEVLHDRKPGVVVRVRDNGCGIAAENLPKVGLPFFTTKSPRGRGLSLCLVIQVVKAAGGEFDLQSVAGKGTTVTLRLPDDFGKLETA